MFLGNEHETICTLMMELKALTKKLFLLLPLFLTIIPISQLHHSRKLSPFPALPPMTKEEEVIKVDGSIPVACQSKCYQCMPIQVLIEEEDGDENEQYYPQVWRCRCGDKVFSP